MKENVFKVEHTRENEVSIIELEGYLDAHTAPILEEALKNEIDNQNFKIIVSFSKLNYISSAGLGVFMAFIEEVRDNNGDIKLCCMSEKVFSVFDLLGFPMLFEIENEKSLLMEKFAAIDSNE